ncbi:MAG: hypothetical protein GXY70_06895 [Euryarchaeota archaeon]|nr:hypothetical protein [Euryarchaeota archaeon]
MVSPKVLIMLFLASLGASALIPLHHIIARRSKGDHNGWTFHSDRLQPLSRPEPRVKIRPVRGGGLVCQICMGRLKDGIPHIKCDCGRVFHITCLKRVGVCPYCNTSYTPEEVEDKAVYPEMQSMECPICGRSVFKDSGSCECGAIIADEEGVFYCPVCGTQIDNGENECPYCHERFEDVSLVECPFCGKVFDENKGICACGTFVGEQCPVCGIRLSSVDEYCPACGARFETLDRPG